MILGKDRNLLVFFTYLQVPLKNEQDCEKNLHGSLTN